MKLFIENLILTCKQSEEVVAFSPQLSFYHGKMSSGKSSIPELINYCLGGRLIHTTALKSELISVRLNLNANGRQIAVERVPGIKGAVGVSWLDKESKGRETMPLSAAENPIFGEDVFNYSDFILKSIGLPILEVRKRTDDEESELVRLSFRDLYEFIYLEQSDLDSSFFLLEQPIRAEKSKDALKFFLGYWSADLNALQKKLQNFRQDQRSKREAAKQITEFLARFGFESETEIERQIDAASKEQEKLEEDIEKLRTEGMPAFLVGEEARISIAKLSERIAATFESVTELRRRIQEQDELIAEFISMKFKAARTLVASRVLEGAKFHACPACGTKVQPDATAASCYLCHTASPENDQVDGVKLEVIDNDLNDRIDDLKKSVTKMKRSLERQELKLARLQSQRVDLESGIAEDQDSHETEYIKRVRAYESKLGAAKERVKFLIRIQKMPTEIERVQKEADALGKDIEETKRLIEEEEAKLIEGDANIKKLEENFINVLLSIKFPGVTPEDKVHINRKSWAVTVLPKNDWSKSWTFYDAGSGGKKVLFKISFALALHKTAAQKKLPIPKLLIIDSPMKNITPDVNPLIFQNFYETLYSNMKDELSEWQVILVDQTFKQPPAEITHTARYMTPDDPQNPPLITYYRGA